MSRTFLRLSLEGTFSRLRLGLAGGRGPEVDGRRPVGRSSRDLPKAPVLLAEPRECLAGGGVGGGRPGANERSSGQRWVGRHWAERSEGQGGSWVSCRGS